MIGLPALGPPASSLGPDPDPAPGRLAQVDGGRHEAQQADAGEEAHGAAYRGAGGRK